MIIYLDDKESSSYLKENVESHEKKETEECRHENEEDEKFRREEDEINERRRSKE